MTVKQMLHVKISEAQHITCFSLWLLTWTGEFHAYRHFQKKLLLVGWILLYSTIYERAVFHDYIRNCPKNQAAGFHVGKSGEQVICWSYIILKARNFTHVLNTNPHMSFYIYFTDENKMQRVCGQCDTMPVKNWKRNPNVFWPKGPHFQWIDYGFHRSGSFSFSLLAFKIYLLNTYQELSIIFVTEELNVIKLLSLSFRV